MALFLVAFALIVAVAVALYWRGKARAEQKANKRAADQASRFHAVSIRIDRGSACDAARQIARQRFLSGEAPTLPLPGCNAAACRCNFKRHSDRRAGPRRASETGGFEPLFSGEEQREQVRGRRAQVRGRRAEDRGERPAESGPGQLGSSSSYYDYISESGSYKKLEED